MTKRKTQLESTSTGDTPGPTPWGGKQTITIQDEEHLDQLGSEFHDRYAEPILQRMFGVCYGNLHLEDLADTYQDGFSSFYAWLWKTREFTLEGKTEDDAWLRLSYRFFERAVIKRWDKIVKALRTVSFYNSDGDVNPETEPLARDLHPEQYEAHARLSEELELAMKAAELNALELLIFRTFIANASGFNARDLFEPLGRFLRNDHNIELSPEEVGRLWRSGKTKLRRYLALHAGPTLRDFVGDNDGIPRPPAGASGGA